MSHLPCVCLQVDGDIVHGISLEEFSEISPDATRVTSKIFLQSIRDIESASQVSLVSHGNSCGGMSYMTMHSHICRAFRQKTRGCSDNSTCGFPANSERR